MGSSRPWGLHAVPPFGANLIAIPDRKTHGVLLEDLRRPVVIGQRALMSPVRNRERDIAACIVHGTTEGVGFGRHQRSEGI